jgi:hypothetical protein
VYRGKVKAGSEPARGIVHTIFSEIESAPHHRESTWFSNKTKQNKTKQTKTNKTKTNKKNEISWFEVPASIRMHCFARSIAAQ